MYRDDHTLSMDENINNMKKIYHYSKKENIESIVNSEKLFFSHLDECKGQEEFSLKIEDYIRILRKLDFSKISFNNAHFDKKRLKFICDCDVDIETIKGIIDDDSYFGKIHAISFTKSFSCNKIEEKFGEYYICFDLDILKRKTGRYAYIFDVIYSLENIEQIVYELLARIYFDFYVMTRYSLELCETDLPDNYYDIFVWGYKLLKMIYKPNNYSFENEIRILIGFQKKDNILNQFNNGYITKRFSKREFGKKIMQRENDYYSLNLEEFKDILVGNNL